MVLYIYIYIYIPCIFNTTNIKFTKIYKTQY